MKEETSLQLKIPETATRNYRRYQRRRTLSRWHFKMSGRPLLVWMIIHLYFLFFKTEIASLVTGQVSLPAIGTWFYTVTHSVKDYTINANLNIFAFIRMSDGPISTLIRHICSHVSSEDTIFLFSVIFTWHHESPKISHTLYNYFMPNNFSWLNLTRFQSYRRPSIYLCQTAYEKRIWDNVRTASTWLILGLI